MRSGNSQCQSSIVKASGMSKAEKMSWRTHRVRRGGCREARPCPRETPSILNAAGSQHQHILVESRNDYFSNPSNSIPWLTIKLNRKGKKDSQCVVISKLTWRETQNKHQNERLPSFPREQSLWIFFPHYYFCFIALIENVMPQISEKFKCSITYTEFFTHAICECQKLAFTTYQDKKVCQH